MAHPAMPSATPAQPVFPREHLTPGEIILFESRPHLLSFLFPAIGAFLVLLFMMVPLAFLLLIPGPRYAGLVFGFWVVFFIVIAMAAVLAQFLRYRGTAYAVTNQRVLSTTGILGRTVVQCKLDKIQNVTFHQGFFMRMFGAGNLIFATAGFGGMMGSPFYGGAAAMSFLGGSVIFVAVPNPVQVKGVVDQVIEEARKAARVEEVRAVSAALQPAPPLVLTGAPLPTTMAPAGGPVARFCPYCGTPRVPGGSHCTNCGNRLPA